jgi:hypothetical protein
MPYPPYIVVNGYVPAGTHDDPSPLDNLRTGVWSFALDQRAFGPRKIVVAFADRDGSFRGLAYTDRTNPAEIGFDACLQYLGAGAAAAIAFCDQPVSDGAPPPGFVELFDRARLIAADYGIHLVDWIACDDDRMRSNRVPLFRAEDAEGAAEGWWDVPAN